MNKNNIKERRKIIMDWFIQMEKRRVVCHDFINQTMNIERCPHEWFFINALLEEIKLNENMAFFFTQYVLQFYPDYEWTNFNAYDILSTILIEISIHNMYFRYVYNGVEDKTKINRGMEFGHIATEFLIRFCNYSLVQTCEQNIILTSRSDCDKYFLPNLLDGYTLFRYAKIEFDSFFRIIKRPVLPTKELYYGQEFIEASNGRFVSIPNYNHTRKRKQRV